MLSLARDIDRHNCACREQCKCRCLHSFGDSFEVVITVKLDFSDDLVPTGGTAYMQKL